MSEIDARAVMRATGVPVGTLNVWINRGYIPGIETSGTRGRARAFDLETVMHVSLMSTLVQLKQPVAFASLAASQARGCFDRPHAKLVIAPAHRRIGLDPLQATPFIDFVEAGPGELGGVLDDYHGGPPEAVLVVDVAAIFQRIRRFVLEPDAMESARRAGVMTGSEKRRYEQAEKEGN